MRRAQNTVKRDSFWRAKVSAAGGAAPLSYEEERNAFGNATARGPLAGFMRLTPDSRAPAKADPSARAGVVVVVLVVVVVVVVVLVVLVVVVVVVVVVILVVVVVVVVVVVLVVVVVVVVVFGCCCCRCRHRRGLS